jgi:two-component system, NarL family, response regulator LiaR
MQPQPHLQPEPELRIVIADDHPFFVEALALTLELDERIEIVGRARHGKEAVELASGLHPDVVLMDLDMPVLDGISATRSVRRVSPASRVIVLTASTSADDERRARDAGAIAFLRKGCHSADLFNAIFAKPPAREGSDRRARLLATRRGPRMQGLVATATRLRLSFR